MRYTLPLHLRGGDSISVQGQSFDVNVETGEFDAPDQFAPHLLHMGVTAVKVVEPPAPAALPAQPSQSTRIVNVRVKSKEELDEEQRQFNADDDAPPAEPDFDNMTKPQLIDYLAAHGVDVKKVKAADLLETAIAVHGKLKGDDAS